MKGESENGRKPDLKIYKTEKSDPHHLLSFCGLQNTKGGCRDKADAEWIVIRRPL
jgi:hypothetical protein